MSFIVATNVVAKMASIRKTALMRGVPKVKACPKKKRGPANQMSRVLSNT